MGLPPAILMLACAATIATGTTTATPDPTVGWQPPSALPFGPALLGGNETALLMRSRTSAACGAWLPPGLARMRGNVPFFRYSTFMARCGHAARGATVAAPADGASAAAFANASELVRGPLGAGFLARLLAVPTTSPAPGHNFCAQGPWHILGDPGHKKLE